MIRVQPLEFQLDPNLLTEGFTQSEMTTWDNCPEMWYLRYNLRLRRKGKWNWMSTFGTWMHAFMEEYYSTKGKVQNWNPQLSPQQLKGIIQNQEWKRDREYWEQVGDTMMQIYASHYKHDHEIMTVLKPGIEYIAETEFMGLKLTGMIDLPINLKTKKANIVVDHKSTNRLDKSVMMGWDFRFQFMFYLWLFRRCNPTIPIHGTMPNAVKKPQLRINYDKESIPEFCRRLKDDMQENPDKYFYRDVMLLKEGDMAHFESQILMPKLYRLKLLLDPKVDTKVKIALARNKNTDYCVKYGAKYACQFLPICQQGLAKNGFQFEKRGVKHEELQEGDQEE